MTRSLSKSPSWVRVAVVVAAYTCLWIAWRSGMQLLHEGFTYFVILFATVVCGALVRHWSVVFLGLVPVMVFLGQDAPTDFFTPVVASCALVGSELARRAELRGRRPLVRSARLERPSQG